MALFPRGPFFHARGGFEDDAKEAQSVLETRFRLFFSGSWAEARSIRCDFSVGGPYFSDSIFLTFRAFSGQALVKKMGSEKCRPLDLSTGNSKEAILGAVRWRTGATGGQGRVGEPALFGED